MKIIGSIKVNILFFIVVTGWVVSGHGIKSIPDPQASSSRNAFEGSTMPGNLYASALFTFKLICGVCQQRLSAVIDATCLDQVIPQ